jgi:hypothetical protein
MKGEEEPFYQQSLVQQLYKLMGSSSKKIFNLTVTPYSECKEIQLTKTANCFLRALYHLHENSIVKELCIFNKRGRRTILQMVSRATAIEFNGLFEQKDFQSYIDYLL